jgi:hypothetical protein
MSFVFTPDTETYKADVVDPGSAAAGTAVGGGLGAGIGALIGMAGGPWGAALGAGIGASIGAPVGTAVGTSVGTEEKEFPVGAGPQGYAQPASPGLNLDSLAWEKLFQSMDDELDSGAVSPASAELYSHTMFGQQPPLPAALSNYSSPSAPLSGYTAPASLDPGLMDLWIP